jgi:ribosomal protein S18 acetylase RimI-like enzyme
MIHRRPATEADEPVLRRLIMATLTEELAAWAWPEAIRGQLLEMQYRIRRQGIAANYAAAEISAIGVDEEPVGWIVAQRSDAELYIVDIAILPAWRCQGIGAAVLRDVLAETDRRRLRARLNVNINNRAVGLYERLGFRRQGGTEVQHFMVRERGQLPAGSPG